MSDQASMRRYLLGTAPAQERAEIEHAFLSDPEQFEELREAENDLIDAYVRGGLSHVERREFEKWYAGSHPTRERVLFAKALAQISEKLKQSETPPERSFWGQLKFLLATQTPKWQWGLTAAAVAAVLFIGWSLVTTDPRLEVSLSHPPAKQAEGPHPTAAGSTQDHGQAPNEGNPSGPEIAKMEPSALDEFTVQLSAGISRSKGSEIKTFAVPLKMPWIGVRLALDSDDYPRYEAIVETAEGTEIQRVPGLGSQLFGGNKLVVLRLPSALIQPGDYVIRLQGVGGTAGNEEVATYAFRATKR
jgi:hypothetical protein